MVWYHEIAYAEATILGTIGAGLCHLAFWLCLTSWEFGLPKHVDAFLSRHFSSMYCDVIRKNYEAREDAREVYGDGGKPERAWLVFMCTLFHHGTAGLLMYIGMITQTPWIWRHGLLTQLFGSDLLDFARMAWNILLPPGSWPTSSIMKKPEFVGVIVMHHLTSLLAGLPGSIYFADQPEFQFMGILLAGYAGCLTLVDVLAKAVHPDWWVVHAVEAVITSGGFFYQRIILYFPLAAGLLQVVYQSEIPFLAKISLAFGGLMMSLFNLALMVLHFKQLLTLASKLRGISKVAAVSAGDGCSTAEPSNKRPVVQHDNEEPNAFPTLLRKRAPEPRGKSPGSSAVCEKTAAAS